MTPCLLRARPIILSCISAECTSRCLGWVLSADVGLVAFPGYRVSSLLPFRLCTESVEDLRPEETEAHYSTHPWNINNLPRHRGSTLRYLAGDELITGVQACRPSLTPRTHTLQCDAQLNIHELSMIKQGWIRLKNRACASQHWITCPEKHLSGIYLQLLNSSNGGVLCDLAVVIIMIFARQPYDSCCVDVDCAYI